MLGGIRKSFGAPDRELIDGRDLLQRRYAISPAQKINREDPELAHRKSETGQHHELRKVPARNKMVLRPVNRKILAPAWLVFHRTAVGQGNSLLINRHYRPLDTFLPSARSAKSVCRWSARSSPPSHRCIPLDRSAASSC